MGKVGAVKFRPFLIKSKKAGTLFLIQPPVTIVTAPEGHWGPDSPDPLRRSAPGGLAKRPELCSLFNPSHYRDSPRGALGTGFPRPLASLRSGRYGKKAGTLFLIQPPVTIVTAPEGHWGPDSPDPLRRSAPGGLAKKAGTLFLIHPQSLS